MTSATTVPIDVYNYDNDELIQSAKNLDEVNELLDLRNVMNAFDSE